MQLETRKLLFDVNSALTDIADFIESKNFSDYQEDALLRAGIERKLEVIGEALKRLRDSSEARCLDRITYWHQAIGLRNVIAHGYDSIRDDILWDVAANKSSEMRKNIKDLLQGEASW